MLVYFARFFSTPKIYSAYIIVPAKNCSASGYAMGWDISSISLSIDSIIVVMVSICIPLLFVLFIYRFYNLRSIMSTTVVDIISLFYYNFGVL